jgi:hypothetical protein
MGKVTAVKHGADEITLSMVRWRARRSMLYLGKKLGLINRFDIALFIPKYEIAVYEGGPDVVSTKKPMKIFYYPNKKIAFKKFDELASIFAHGGIFGDADFIRNGHPREQSVFSRASCKIKYWHLLSEAKYVVWV